MQPNVVELFHHFQTYFVADIALLDQQENKD